MSSQDQREAKLTLIVEISAREFHVPFPFCHLPELVYVMSADEDEPVVIVMKEME